MCVVFGVKFYGPTNITDDPLVRFAFQRALFVSAGMPYFNTEVALPTQAKLCGVNVTNEGGFRRALSGSGADANAMSASSSLARIIETEQTSRRQEVFGISDFNALRATAQDGLDLYASSHPHPSKISLLRSNAPDTNVFFSVVSNVIGKAGSPCWTDLLYV